MAEGIRRSGETQPHGADIPERVLVDRTDAEEGRCVSGGEGNGRPKPCADTVAPNGENLAPPRQPAGLRPPGPPSETSAPSTRPVLKRPRWLVVAIIALSVVALAGGRYYQYMVAHEWTDDAFIEARVIQISPKVAGHILQVHVVDNQEVQQDALLLEIDPRDYAARLTQARAVLQAALAKQQAAQTNVVLTHVTSDAGIQQATAGVEWAKAAVQTARAQVVTARSRLEQTRAQVDTAVANTAQVRAQVAAAEAEVTRADADVKRSQQLYGNDQIVSRQNLDHATRDTRIATAQLEATRKRVLAAEAQVAEARAAQQTAAENL